jgi:hypothetical protein
MDRCIANQADRRVPIAMSVLTAVLALLGAHRIDFRSGGPAAGRSVEMASAMVTSPAPTARVGELAYPSPTPRVGE